MAWVLGLLMSDGCLHKDYYCNRIEWYQKDKQLLNQIRKALKSTHPIKPFKCNDEHWVLQVDNKHMFNSLLQLGLTPKKSFTVKLPDNVPQIYLRHLIRGLFDGDGGYHINKKTKRILINYVTYSPELRRQLEPILKTDCKLNKKKLFYEQINRQGNLGYTLSFSSNKDVISFYEYLYDCCPDNLSLKRKRVGIKTYLKTKNLI